MSFCAAFHTALPYFSKTIPLVYELMSGKINRYGFVCQNRLVAIQYRFYSINFVLFFSFFNKNTHLISIFNNSISFFLVFNFIYSFSNPSQKTVNLILKKIDRIWNRLFLLSNKIVNIIEKEQNKLIKADEKASFYKNSNYTVRRRSSYNFIDDARRKRIVDAVMTGETPKPVAKTKALQPML